MTYSSMANSRSEGAESYSSVLASLVGVEKTFRRGAEEVRVLRSLDLELRRGGSPPRAAASLGRPPRAPRQAPAAAARGPRAAARRHPPRHRHRRDADP